MNLLIAAAAAMFVLAVFGARARRQRALRPDGAMVSRAWLMQHRAGAEADHRFPS